MQYLFDEFGTGIALIIVLIGVIVWLYLLFLVIKWGVSAGNERQNDLLEQIRNDLKNK